MPLDIKQYLNQITTPGGPVQNGPVSQQKITVRFPDGTSQEWPAGTPNVVWQTEAKQKFDAIRQAPTLLGGQPQVTEGEPMSPDEVIKRLSTGGLDFASAVTSIIPGAPGIFAPAMLSTLSAALKGENPIEAASQQMALGMGGRGAASVIPKVTTHLALALGGGIQRLGKEFGRATSAFNRQAARRMVPIPVGGNTAKAAAGMGKQLEQAELASLRANPLTELLGANDDYARGAINTTDPWTLQEGIKEFEKTNIVGAAGSRAGLSRSAWDKLSPSQQVALIKDTNLTTRELGEFQRGIGKKAAPVVKARAEKVFIPAEADEAAQMQANLTRRMRDIRHGPADIGAERTDFQKFFNRTPKPGQTGAIKNADSILSDYKQMQNANESLRSGGIWGDIGVWSMRAALAGGIARALGVPWAQAGLVGLAGVPGLSPKAISGAGFGASKLAEAAPGAVRLYDSWKDLTSKRRKPL